MLSHFKNATAVIAIVIASPMSAEDRNLRAEGFVLSLDGETFVGDTAVKTRVDRVEMQLATADVDISYDGPVPSPVLNLTTTSRAGGTEWLFSSTTNYPAYIARGEIRLMDLGAAGGPRLLAVAPLRPNSQLALQNPKAVTPAVVYRVYDAHGRYDETAMMRLNTDVTLHEATSEVRNIRVRGGAVSVSAQNISQNSRLLVFGETIRPDQSGRVQLQRILPSGLHEIDVVITGGARNLSFGRDIEIETSDWFYVVVADATLWMRKNGETGERYAENLARLQFYVAGETQNGVEVAASLDTGEGDIRDIFSNLTEKDPRSVAGRLLEDNAHVTYGDDSTSEDLTPTSGRVYLRVARDESYAVWGDYQAQISGSEYLRNERNLYGLQLHFETNSTTGRGNAHATVDAFAAQPDQLLGRDVFLGTGGSVYFLSRQDIAAGTAVVHVLYTDKTTGRVIERVALREGADFELNALQGVVSLNAPLQGQIDSGLISNAGGDTDVRLEVLYEYTPIGIDGSGVTAGARFETWMNDDLRFGATLLHDDSGSADQTAQSVDLQYLIGANSHVQLDYAQSKGPGYESINSVDGGLILDTRAANAGSGEAVRVAGKLDLADVSDGLQGSITGYTERRREGFNTLDYEVDATTGDQLLYGFSVSQTLTSGLTYSAHFDHLDNTIGTDVTEIGAEVAWDVASNTTLAFGAETLREKTAGSTLARVDAAMRLTRRLGDASEVYAFGQTTVDNNGLDDNDRAGVGFSRSLDTGWSIGAELSDGTTGIAAAARLAHDNGNGDTIYFGYELDPSTTYGTGVSQRDSGRFVLGGKRQVNSAVSIFAESTYDLLGERREVISSNGIDITATEFLTFGGSYVQGRITDLTNGDLSRDAVSLSASYEDAQLAARVRFEYRQDKELAGSQRKNTDTTVVSSDAEWRITDSQRLLFSLGSSQTEQDTGSLLGGTFTEATFGYAHRAIDGGRMNVLTSYRYLYDTYGQSIDGVAGEGAVQESHILNLEANYAVSTEWTLGGKLGYRGSLSAPQKGSTMVQNDAMLAVANARYHLLKDWDVLLEARHFTALDAQFSETGALAAAYKQFGENLTIGVGYNFTSFSDDLGDLTFDDEGVFLNIVAAY